MKHPEKLWAVINSDTPDGPHEIERDRNTILMIYRQKEDAEQEAEMLNTNALGRHGGWYSTPIEITWKHVSESER